MPAPKGHPPYPGCETGGRPKKYTKEYGDAEADHLIQWMQDNPDVIFIERYCYFREIPEFAISELDRCSEKFSKAYEKLKLKQKFTLYENGLSGLYKHNMCALILAHNHGVRESKETVHSGNPEKPLAFVNQLQDQRNLINLDIPEDNENILTEGNEDLWVDE